MQIEPEISFHRCEPSDAVKDAIGRHIEHLEKIFGRMTSCRVRIDQLHQNTAGKLPPVVRIEISVPGQKDIVVAHETGHLQRKFQSPDVRNAVNEAFRIAEQRLAQAKDILTDHKQVQTHEAAHEFRGQIAEMPPEKDFGFLLTASGGLLYFHRNSLLGGEFDSLRRGDGVTYVAGEGDTGPTASKVRVLERA